MWNPFAKKAVDEFGEREARLRKVISKKDDTDVSEAIGLIRDMMRLDSARMSELVVRESAKKGSWLIPGLVSKTLLMDEEPFSDQILAGMIDNSLRYGGKSDQRSAVLLIKKYSKHADLLARYKLVYVRDAKSQKMLSALY